MLSIEKIIIKSLKKRPKDIIELHSEIVKTFQDMTLPQLKNKLIRLIESKKIYFDKGIYYSF
jgi:transcriptional regulator with PAS, ATPase and Fis domain